MLFKRAHNKGQICYITTHDLSLGFMVSNTLPLRLLEKKRRHLKATTL